MTERELTNEEITAKIECFTEAMEQMAILLKQMTENMNHVVRILRMLAEMQGVDVSAVTLPDDQKEETP